MIAVVVVSLLPWALLTWASAPAAAHPFGPPPTAVVSARGQTVVVEWRSAADDAIAIGVQVGLLPENLPELYREGATQVAPSSRDEEALAASPQLRDYLLRHVAVEQDRTPCDGKVLSTEDFVWQGARLLFRCPSEVEEIVLRVSLLHDIHEAYRTFGIIEGAQPDQAVFSLTSPQATIAFGAPAPTGSNRAGTGGWLPLAIVVAVLLLGVLAFCLRRSGP